MGNVYLSSYFPSPLLGSPQSPDNPTPYATTMLLAGSGSDNCKHSHSSHDPCSSGTSSPHSDPQFQTNKSGLMHGGPYPPHGGECLSCRRSEAETGELCRNCFDLHLEFSIVPANWTEFLPPPPEHPPPLPSNPIGMCYTPTSPLNGKRELMNLRNGPR